MGARGGPAPAPAPLPFPLPFPLPLPAGAGPAERRAMIAVSIAVSVAAAEPPRSPGRAHTVFRVEVLCNGRRHTVTKRYSEFQALHKQIKKTCKVPNFPARHVSSWMPKGLEQRRQGLEVYLQGVLDDNEELPQEILEFLKVRCCQQHPKASSPLSTTLLPSQRPIVGFCWDPYVRPHGTELLPNTIVSGVLQGLYLPLSCSLASSTPSLCNDEFHPAPRDAVVIEKDL